MGLGGLLGFGKNKSGLTQNPGESMAAFQARKMGLITAPAPTTAADVPAIGTPTPPDTAAAAAAAIPAAQNAAKKARRKGIAPGLPASRTLAPTPKTVARGLFGF